MSDPQSVFASALSIALRIVSARLLAFLALGMTFGLFCWALHDANWISYIGASTFGLIVYLPALWSAHRGSTDG
jgi:hypothetical protein